MGEESGGSLGRRITLWTALSGLVGGMLGGGAEGLLKWLEFREHLSETQQQQVLEVVKLATDLDKNRVASAADYIQILSDELPPTARDRLLVIVTRSATSGSGANPQVVAQVTAAFPQAVDATPELRALVLPGHPRLFIQIAREDQREAAEKIRSSLAATNVDAPGIELMQRYAGASEVRYFFPEDKDEAATLTARLNIMLPGLTRRIIGGYTQKPGVKPQLFELWIGPQVTAVTDQGVAGAAACRK
jgi:hypothetical protein